MLEFPILEINILKILIRDNLWLKIYYQKTSNLMTINLFEDIF